MAQVHMTVDPFHLGSLFSLRTLLTTLASTRRPVVRTLGPLGSTGAIAVLPGSFNPPTAAHVVLAERARAEGYGTVLFSLARRTVGKDPGGLILEDRLMALRAVAGDTFGVAACSHGLYVDQAEAIAEAAPGTEQCFLVGSDKVLQLFDERWYPDRDAALERFFSLAGLIVAPRSDQAELLRATLDAPRNRRFADRVSVLRLHPAVSDTSSTRVRGLLRSGADPAGLVPAGVARLLAETKAFTAPMVIGGDEVDAYDARVRLIDLIWDTRGLDGIDIDLHRLTTIALSPTPAGRRLRTMLADGGAGLDDLMDAQAMAAAL